MLDKPDEAKIVRRWKIEEQEQEQEEQEEKEDEKEKQEQEQEKNKRKQQLHIIITGVWWQILSLLKKKNCGIYRFRPA